MLPLLDDRGKTLTHSRPNSDRAPATVPSPSSVITLPTQRHTQQRVGAVLISTKDDSRAEPSPVTLPEDSLLESLLNAMDEMAGIGESTSRIILFANALSITLPRKVATSAIRAVLARLMRPTEFTSDRAAILHYQSTSTAFVMTRHQLHHAGHVRPVAECDAAKVLFLLVHPRGLHVYAGTRRDSYHGPQLRWDLPGGKRIPEDANVRATAWREVADEELNIQPIVRAKLARELASQDPVTIHQDFPRGQTFHIALWTCLLQCTDHSLLSTAPAGADEWFSSGWIPIGDFIDSLEQHQLTQYATGVQSAVEETFQRREILLKEGANRTPNITA